MILLNLFHKKNSLGRRIRGTLINYFFLAGRAKKLSVSNDVEIWGEVTIGKKVFIGSNVKIYKKSFISDQVYLGDNVELRCNNGNVIKIGENCTVNRGTLIMGQVEIGHNCLIAPNCVVVGSNHNFSDIKKLINLQGISSKGILIEENVWLGAQVTVLDGVKIGKNSIIGAGAVVTKSIPSNSIAVGNPCKVVKSRI